MKKKEVDNKDSLLISIIVPVYNSELYVEKCIRSILQQTYKAIEVIIVDDGSSDDSYNICKRLASNDKRIRIYKQNKQGNTAARKKGLQVSKGKYVGFVDSDDYIMSDMFECLLKLIINSQVDIVCSAMITEGGTGKIQNTNALPEGKYLKDKLIKIIYPQMLLTERESEFGVLPNLWNKLFKREIIYQTLMDLDDDIIYGEDAACVYKCLLNANSILLTDKAWYVYQIRENSICTSVDYRRWNNIPYLYNYFQKTFGHLRYSQILMNQLNRFVVKMTIRELKNSFQIMFSAFYQFPFELINKEDKIVIFGAGSVGRSYIKQLELCQYNVVLWVDNKNGEVNGIRVGKPAEVKTASFDWILIAIANEKYVDDIKCQLSVYGIEEKKILWSEPKWIETTYWLQ